MGGGAGMSNHHVFESCELMSDLSADILLPGEEAFCCICAKHKCEKATNKNSLLVQSAFPPETSITVNGKTFLLADIDKEMT
jgi:hypothetical protein